MAEPAYRDDLDSLQGCEARGCEHTHDGEPLYLHPRWWTQRQRSSGAYERPSMRRRLNPAFDAWLMGWPPFWSATGSTDCGASAMESYLCAQRSLLRRLLNGQASP